MDEAIIIFLVLRLVFAKHGWHLVELAPLAVAFVDELGEDVVSVDAAGETTLAPAIEWLTVREWGAFVSLRVALLAVEVLVAHVPDSFVRCGHLFYLLN